MQASAAPPSSPGAKPPPAPSAARGTRARRSPEARRADEIFGVLAQKDPVQHAAGRRAARTRRPDRTSSGRTASTTRCPVGSGGARRRAAGLRTARPAAIDLGLPSADALRPRRPGNWTCRRNRRPRRWPARRTALRGDPCCTIRPLRRTQIVSLIDSASSWSWVTRTKVMPTSRCRFCSSICMSRRSLRSSAASGSSSSSTVGRLTSARASATRCCWPPDSSQTRRRAIAGQAHQLEHRVDLPPEFRLVGPGRALPEPVGDVGGDIEMREQRVVLEHHVHRPAIGRHAHHRPAADPHVPGRRLLEARDQAQARWSCRSPMARGR